MDGDSGDDGRDKTQAMLNNNQVIGKTVNNKRTVNASNWWFKLKSMP